MFGKIMKRGFRGFVYFVMLTYLMSILRSVNAGTGNYNPVLFKGIAQICSSQLGIVLIQLAVASIVGFAMGALTVIWDVESWSIAKQTAVHFCVMAPCLLAAEWICGWMKHTVTSFFIWLGIFVAVYSVSWFLCWMYYKRSIKQINQKLKEHKE